MLGNQTEEDTVLPMKTCTGRRAAGEVPSSEATWGHASRVCLVPVTVQIASQCPLTLSSRQTSSCVRARCILSTSEPRGRCLGQVRPVHGGRMNRAGQGHPGGRRFMPVTAEITPHPGVVHSATWLLSVPWNIV